MLARAKDATKDQSYFLAAVPAAVGAGCWVGIGFPLGGWTKEAVRVRAAAAGLGPRLAEKRSSVGLCFVGKRKHFGDFLGGYLEAPGGAPGGDGPVEAVAGRAEVGRHRGLWRYTLGQAARLAGQVRTLREGNGPSHTTRRNRPRPSLLVRGQAGGRGARWFVVGKDAAAGALLVGRGRCHPALFSATAVGLGLGRILALHRPSSTSHQSCEEIQHLSF